MSKPHYVDSSVTLHHGGALDVVRSMTNESVDCIVTSPPYFGLRNYGDSPEQYGIEESPAMYVRNLRDLFAELRRVLALDGTAWLNIGDSYYSGKGNPGPNAADGKQSARRGWTRALDKPGQTWAKPKNLLGIPWMVAHALQADGWTLRNSVVWVKPNAMPDPTGDRLARKYEHIFMLTKSRRYWFDAEAASEWGGDVWTIATTPFTGGHAAVFPPELPRRCIVAGCKPGGLVLDPFHGSGTTGVVAVEQGRRYVGIDLSEEYLDLSLTHPKRFGGSVAFNLGEPA